MLGTAKVGLQLPKFQRNAKQRGHIASERRTAKLIRALWNAAGQKQRNDPAFLNLLVQLGWTNKTAREANRRWRNRKLADYLHVPYTSDQELADELHLKFQSMTSKHWQAMLMEGTGITWYFNPFRPETLSFVSSHSKSIALAFKLVSQHSANVHEKVRRIAQLIESLGTIHIAGKSVDLFKGLSPALSCLDPQSRFPIMNKRSRNLLRCIEAKENEEGIVALSKLIGSAQDIHDARELDVYSTTEKFPKLQAPKAAKLPKKGDYKNIGLKSEINSFAQIAAKKTTITKLHNKLINRLTEYLLWRYVIPKESRFDALVYGWKGNRDLLIEAKTASEGATGRTQVRQAIGQLYDYRFTFMPKKNVDLAILLPKEPGSDVKRLLNSLGIELLWFKGKKLTGTIQL